VPGVEVKIVNGEMRLRAPTMFSRYLSPAEDTEIMLTSIRYLSDDPSLTAKSFDEEGYFLTGDCAEMIGDSYKLHGRANIDGLEYL
jgi:malonyl-CoA/methylmalonyl-CoA synthetase